jgi:tripartite-type tricarboxylate transporter receptor subunit TctC
MKVRTLATSLLLAFSTLANAQGSFPNKPVTLVSPFTPGGAGEAIFRPLVNKLSARWGQPVILENKPGANGLIGTQYVMRAPADGHTILFHVPGILQNALLMKDAKYDPFRDFRPVINLGSQPLVLATSGKNPYRNLKELVEAGRAPGAGFSFGSIGPGSTYHIYGELLASSAGIDMPHIPYKGTSPMMTDLMTGQITTGFVTAHSAILYNQDGRLRPLAVGGTKRIPALPDVPTFAELGYKGFEQVGWYGLFVPRATPDAVVEKMAADIADELKKPDMAKIMNDLYIIHSESKPSQFDAILRNDYKKWQELIARFNIRLE